MICLGKSITFAGSGIYPQNDVLYHQSNNTSHFYWDLGDGTIDSGQVITKTYTMRRGYDIMLKIVDSTGCISTNAIAARVRISSRPTTTIQPLADMCTGNTKLISVGYSPNSVVLVEPMGFIQTSKQGYDSTLFLPDGPICLPGIYNTFVVFNNFPPGAVIQSATDILAICVNMEHSYAGDLGFRIMCPNSTIVVLDPNTHSGGNFLGVPAGGLNHHNFDNGCLPANNPYGVGWNYCWSEVYPNNNMTFDQLSSSAGAGTVTPVGGGRTIDSTNQSLHTNYIKPQNPLAGLIGCPLNGTWNIEIKDDFGSDNGYIFGWNLELQANLMPNNWTYNVKIDSVGFSGPFITPLNDTTAIIIPTTGGNYLYHISLVDEFGCVWDTNANMTVITTPHPYIGSDTSICYPYGVILDPGNIGTIYSWTTPKGILTTQSILTDTTLYSGIPIPFNYVVSVSNVNVANTLTCTGYDTVLVTVNPKPEPSFTPIPSFTSGCDPFVAKFDNSTTPSSCTYLWNFGSGQGTDTATSPTHSFPAGEYEVTLTATTLEGCIKTFSTGPGFVIVFPQPHADFTWTPEFGTRVNPTINFQNLTTPVGQNFLWNWDFGDLGTSTVKDPQHDFIISLPEAKEFLVTLIATNDHGASIQCTDTVSYKVKIIDDVLIFPNFITPNGDAMNDRFEIGTLIKGGAYKETQVIIYNRWGKKVYENNNYDNSFNGEGLPAGVYFVTIKAKGVLRDIDYKGSLEILR
ncbi:MAG: PKD domain-containing protein [Bacteroidetes bacterium]|nr:PKD domain-containing protein [Bacteroidota bacterium]